MKLSFLFFYCTFFANLALAEPGNYRLVSLYSENAYLTQRFIPFAVQDSSGNPVEVEGVDVGKPCHGMVDPHRRHIVHLYCSHEVMAQFVARIKVGGQNYQLRSPNIPIKKLALISSTPLPGDGDVETLGQRKFTVNCAGCHPAPNPLPKTVTVAKLKSAFDKKPGEPGEAMSAFKNFFTDEELNALVQYINEDL